VFAGLLTKVGVYAIIRVQTLLFPDSPLNDLLLWAAILTMVIGILGAVAQSDMKRVLSFTLVSHIGFMLFGVALSDPLGLTGAVFYITHHIIVQTALFLVVGLVEYREGTTNTDRLGGLARTAPILAVMFFVPAMNLAGIPPLSGFLGKLALIRGGVGDGSALAYVAIAASLATSLLTLYALAKVWSRAFWQPLEDATEPSAPIKRTGSLHGRSGVSTKTAITSTWQRAVRDQRLPIPMALPTLALVLASTALTVAAGPLFSFTQRAADELHQRTPYIQTTLAGESP